MRSNHVKSMISVSGALQPGGSVLFVSGAHRGAEGKLVEINTDKYQAKVRAGQFVAHTSGCASLGPIL